MDGSEMNSVDAIQETEGLFFFYLYMYRVSQI